MADERPRSIRRRVALLAATLLAATLLAAVLVACGGGGGSSASSDPLVGYWAGGGTQGQMTLIEIRKAGDGYTVSSNPDHPLGDVRVKDDTLTVDTHAVLTTFKPRPPDKLEVTFSGDMFKTPQSTTLSRVNQQQYADAAVALGLQTLKSGLEQWKAGGGKDYPPASEVTPNGMLAQMIGWPVNLFTGGPMVQKASAGDFTYRPLAGGKKYSLKGYLSDGSTIGQ